MMDYGMSDAEERAVFGYDDCPVCDDDDCECDYIGTRVAAAFSRADDRIKQMKEEGEWPWWK